MIDPEGLDSPPWSPRQNRGFRVPDLPRGHVRRERPAECPAQQLAEQLGDAVWSLVQKWRGLPRDVLATAIVRATDRVGATLSREPNGGESAHAALLNLRETRYLLRQAYRRRLLSEADTRELQRLSDALGRALELPPDSIAEGDDGPGA
ncbi:MAG: four helix bundle protein [Candidatus Schekmanbacteria bacterium]|nr:four helix bundle protein [Candidatus Schekmanbacteria bacterium]